MQTVEFDSYVENGVISIPLQYQYALTHSVRVTIQPREESPDTPHNTVKRKKLFSLAVDMNGFTFDRDEINER